MLFIKILTSGTVLLQLVAAISILVMYVVIIQILRKSEAFIQKQITYKHSETRLLIQIIIVTGSNILCWVPSGAI